LAQVNFKLVGNCCGRNFLEGGVLKMIRCVSIIKSCRLGKVVNSDQLQQWENIAGY